MTSERTLWRYIQVYKYRWAGRLCRSLTPRAWRALFIPWGRGWGRSFVATKEQLRDPPLKHTVWFLSPHIGGGRFHDTPSSIPATTKSQCNYMQASDIYINAHVLWTLNNNFTYLVIWYELNCLSRVSLLISSKSLKTKSLSLSSYSLSNSSSYSSSPDSPSLSSLAPHDSSVLIDSLTDVSVIMTSNNFYFVIKLPTNSGQSMFQVVVKFFYL